MLHRFWLLVSTELRVSPSLNGVRGGGVPTRGGQGEHPYFLTLDQLQNGAFWCILKGVSTFSLEVQQSVSCQHLRNIS